MFSLPFTLSPETVVLLVLIALIANVLLVIALLMQARRIGRFTRGANGKALEHAIRDILAHDKESEQFEREVVRAVSLLDKRIKGSVRGTATLRFDAFKGDGSGGKQSFSTALLSELGDGVVISSLHARGSSRIFAKPITAFASEYELTDEEKAAIAEAREKTLLKN